MEEEILKIIKMIPIPRRSVVKEHKMFKVYLPLEYNDVWRALHEQKRKVDVVVNLPRMEDAPIEVRLAGRILMRRRTIVKEKSRFKLYLSSRYNDIWERLWRRKLKVDMLVALS
jgi:hypothetical protein